MIEALILIGFIVIVYAVGLLLFIRRLDKVCKDFSKEYYEENKERIEKEKVDDDDDSGMWWPPGHAEATSEID